MSNVILDELGDPLLDEFGAPILDESNNVQPAYQIPYLTPPASIVNQALDKLGAYGDVIGDLTDGTKVAEVARRNYGRLVRQLLRANHWPFARSEAQLLMLGDATGASSPPISSQVEQPWNYAYAWPQDAVQGRWMPMVTPLMTNQPPTATPNPPLMSGPSPFPGYGPRNVPARFLVSSSNFYPIQTGVQPWMNLPDLQRTEGLGPTYRKIILTDICQAIFVYTRLVTVIEEWDDDFREAMVCAMAVVLAPTVIADPKVRLAEVGGLIAVAKDRLNNARMNASNEAGFPMTTDHQPLWITRRNGWGWGRDAIGAGGNGGFGLGWEGMSMGGSVF